MDERAARLRTRLREHRRRKRREQTEIVLEAMSAKGFMPSNQDVVARSISSVIDRHLKPSEEHSIAPSVRWSKES